MNMVFDPLNLLLLGIAVVVFWRLRGVLGMRTGAERPPVDPYAKPQPKARPEAANGNVIRLPREDQPPVTKGLADPPPPAWVGFAPEGSPLALAIGRLVSADPGFSPRAFLDGARRAYELVLEAFAKGDKAALANLLARSVMSEFARAIDQRQSQGQRLDWRFVGIDKAELVAITVDGARASVTVNFAAEAISATYGKDGTLVEGDASAIAPLHDVWTFERDISAKDPNWKLAATGGAA